MTNQTLAQKRAKALIALAAKTAVNLAAARVRPEISANTERLSAIESALIRLGVLAETIEGLKLPEWKGNIEGQLIWIKVLVGVTGAAAVGQLVINLIRGG